MHLYSMEKIAYEKIAEERHAAARIRLAVEADRARREARQAAGSPVARLLRTLASAFGRGGPALERTVPAGHTQ